MAYPTSDTVDLGRFVKTLRAATGLGPDSDNRPVATFKMVVETLEEKAFTSWVTNLRTVEAEKALRDVTDDPVMAAAYTQAMLAAQAADAPEAYAAPGSDRQGIDLDIAEIVETVVLLRNPAENEVHHVRVSTLKTIVPLLPTGAFTPKLTTLWRDEALEAVLAGSDDIYIRAATALVAASNGRS